MLKVNVRSVFHRTRARKRTPNQQSRDRRGRNLRWNLPLQQYFLTRRLLVPLPPPHQSRLLRVAEDINHSSSSAAAVYLQKLTRSLPVEAVRRLSDPTFPPRLGRRCLPRETCTSLLLASAHLPLPCLPPSSQLPALRRVIILSRVRTTKMTITTRPCRRRPNPAPAARARGSQARLPRSTTAKPRRLKGADQAKWSCSNGRLQQLRPPPPKRPFLVREKRTTILWQQQLRTLLFPVSAAWMRVKARKPRWSNPKPWIAFLLRAAKAKAGKGRLAERAVSLWPGRARSILLWDGGVTVAPSCSAQYLSTFSPETSVPIISTNACPARVSSRPGEVAGTATPATPPASHLRRGPASDRPPGVVWIGVVVLVEVSVAVWPRDNGWLRNSSSSLKTWEVPRAFRSMEMWSRNPWHRPPSGLR